MKQMCVVLVSVRIVDVELVNVVQDLEWRVEVVVEVTEVLIHKQGKVLVDGNVEITVICESHWEDQVMRRIRYTRLIGRRIVDMVMLQVRVI